MRALFLSLRLRPLLLGIVRTANTTSNPGPFGIEAAREKALVKSGHVTPQILDIFVTWP